MSDDVAPMSIEQMGAIFYPTTPAPETPTAAPADDDALAALYDRDVPAKATAAIAAGFEVPAAIAALRKADIHGGAHYFEDAIGEADITDADDIPAEVKTAALGELRQMMSDTNIAPAEAREVVTLAQSIAANPPTPEIEAEWQAEASKRVLELANGDSVQAQRDVDLARALIQRDPRMARLLDESRLGSHPRIIALAIQLARSEAAAGRLTYTPKEQ